MPEDQENQGLRDDHSHMPPAELQHVLHIGPNAKRRDRDDQEPAGQIHRDLGDARRKPAEAVDGGQDREADDEGRQADRFRVAAPLTGLLVQPVIGHLSDRTWLGRLGRRRPYFLAGAILAAVALLAMPQSQGLLMAALLLWMLDASLNISMEPFRAFVGDMLDKSQHATGYAVQTAFIGSGAVVAAIFPWFLEHLGVANIAPPGQIPDTVRWSFWAGGGALFVAIAWTVLTTREYSPEEMAAFEAENQIEQSHTIRALAAKNYGFALVWLVAGAAVILAVAPLGLEKEIYLLGGLLASGDLLDAAGPGIVFSSGGRLFEIWKIFNNFRKINKNHQNV